MMLVKFTFNVWEDEIVPTLSELHGARCNVNCNVLRTANLLMADGGR